MSATRAADVCTAAMLTTCVERLRGGSGSAVGPSLHEAAAAGELERVALLLESEQLTNAASSVDGHGWTALMKAARFCHLQGWEDEAVAECRLAQARLFIERGADALMTMPVGATVDEQGGSFRYNRWDDEQQRRVVDLELWLEVMADPSQRAEGMVLAHGRASAPHRWLPPEPLRSRWSSGSTTIDAVRCAIWNAGMPRYPGAEPLRIATWMTTRADLQREDGQVTHPAFRIVELLTKAARRTIARRRLAALFRAALALLRAATRAVERLYAPGGAGYEAALAEFGAGCSRLQESALDAEGVSPGRVHRDAHIGLMMRSIG